MKRFYRKDAQYFEENEKIVRMTKVDAGLGTRDKVLVIFKLGLGLGRSCVGLHHGTFSGKRILTQLPCNFVTTNKSSDSVTATIPQCNATSPRPTLMVDLKIALLGQCRLFHVPVFKILVKGLGPFWFFGGPFCVSSSGPFRALGSFL